MSETLRFLLAVELLGLAGLPLAQLAFGRLAGGGVAFARPIALLLLSWLVMAAGIAGIPNGLGLVATCAGVVALLGLGAWPIARRTLARAHPDEARHRRRVLIATEAVVVVLFLGGTLFNSFSPDVWNTEKPMDMAMVTSMLASSDIPPHSPWQSGEQLNYYYLGQLASANLIALTDVEPSRGYNLSLAVVLALLGAAAFGLATAIAEEARRRGAAVRRPTLAGGGAVVLTLLAGTVQGGLDALAHGGPWERFDWFGASRVIPGTINEFPFFSFLLGDLHAHVIVAPFLLLAVAFAVQVALHGPPRGVVRRPAEIGLAGLAIGCLYAISAWSAPVGGGLFLLGALAWGRRALLHVALVYAAALVVVLPFAVEYDPVPHGVGLVDEREPLGDFLSHHGGLYGALLWCLAMPFAGRLLGARHRLRVLVWGGSGVVVAVALLAGADLAGAFILAALGGIALHALLSRRSPEAERPLWLLTAGGLICLLVPEILHVRDEFEDGELYRMNTVFKMGHQAWLLLAVAAACALPWAASWVPRVPHYAWLAGAAALVAISSAFTVVGSYARKEAFADGPSLDGRAWLQRDAPGDPAAIDWLRENTPGDAVVLEAVGDDYSPFGHARISTFSGRTTVMGWEGHELQWGHDPRGRRGAVRAIYGAPDPATARRLLREFGVSYVVIGPLERTDYGDAEAIVAAGRKVFDRAGTQIYEFDAPRERDRDEVDKTPEP